VVTNVKETITEFDTFMSILMGRVKDMDKHIEKLESDVGVEELREEM